MFILHLPESTLVSIIKEFGKFFDRGVAYEWRFSWDDMTITYQEVSEDFYFISVYKNGVHVENGSLLKDGNTQAVEPNQKDRII